MPTKRFAKTVASLFGLQLRKARVAAGLTQQVLAERAEIDTVFVSFLENGHRQPSVTVVILLERALGLAPGTLLQAVAAALAKADGAKGRMIKPSSGAKPSKARRVIRKK